MKNKKILIISIISIIILVAIILGVLYFTTDLFKTNQQLFYKYLSKTEIIKLDFVEAFNKSNDKILKNNNSSTANIDISTSQLNEETGIADIEKVLSIKSNGLKNANLKQLYRDFTVSSNGQNFLTLKYIKDNNLYGLGADNILSKYISIENSNLKQLASNLGVADTSQIPNSIISTDYEKIFDIDDDTFKYLKDKYYNLVYQNIDKTKFYKTVNNDKTETIGLSLTEQETVNIEKIILETLKNDTTFLNLVTSKAKLLGYTEVTNETVQLKIQEIIDKITNNTYSSEKDFLKISLLKSGEKVIKVSFETLYKEDIKQDYLIEEINNINSEVKKIIIDIDISEENKIVLLLKENDTETIKIIFNYTFDDNNININTEISQKQIEESNNLIKLQYQISNYQTDNITQNCWINTASNDKKNYQIDIINEIALKQDIQIEKLTTENSAKLNDMTQEQISSLFIALDNRIRSLYGDNLKIFGIEINNTENENIENNY